ncbi:radical SAM protein [Croceitalea sp. MTPC5]|uniref:B12-binding domain-containing radical SAM protein n=1 Tax=Croceitalea sp. MTPC5 TaxID=3056565 RepID=UPI002B3BE7D6|nr:radical SAM protein [Croceitalea sp. MTPC5]
MKKKKPHIILINSPLFRFENPNYDEDSLPPLGLGYIATYLNENGVDVTVKDAIATQTPLNELIEYIDNVQPDFIGINIFTTNYDLVKELIESIATDSHIIIGGLSTKELYKDIFQWKTTNKIDVVTGDGEYITLDIIKNQVKQSPNKFSTNRNLYTVDTSSEYYVKNLNSLKLDRKYFVNEPIEHPLGFKEANIVTSRGCIFSCAFCAAAYGQNKEFGIRERSVDSVQNELRALQSYNQNIDSVRVLDDLFLKTKRHIEYAIDVFKPFNFSWRSMAHVQTFKNVSVEDLIKLKDSGCSEVFIGIESGSPKILKSINKTSKVDVILNNLSNVLIAGIAIKAYFIFGFPNETEEDMEHTYQLAYKLSEVAKKNNTHFRTSVFQYRPYHGTTLYEALLDEGHNPQEVTNILPDDKLSGVVKRLQYNFHSGNYSKVGLEILHSYICKTTNLNSTALFESLQNNNKSKKIKSLQVLRTLH